MENEIERRLAIIENELFGRSGTYWHETGVFADGSHWGKIGAMTHIIDPATRRAISRGYHDITPLGFGRYQFSIGATDGSFELSPHLTGMCEGSE